LLIFFNLPHDFANLGSVGHAALRFLKRKIRFKEIIEPAKIKMKFLCSETNSNCGKLVLNPTKAAPAPSKTNKVGKAQQNRVPKEAKRDKKDTRQSKIFFIIYALNFCKLLPVSSVGIF
jgi:hypothetical protein